MSRDQRTGKKKFRKDYTGSKRFDKSCRNHGGCPWCESSRLRYKRFLTADDNIIKNESEYTTKSWSEIRDKYSKLTTQEKELIDENVKKES